MVGHIRAPGRLGSRPEERALVDRTAVDLSAVSASARSHRQCQIDRAVAGFLFGSKHEGQWRHPQEIELFREQYSSIALRPSDFPSVPSLTLPEIHDSVTYLFGKLDRLLEQLGPVKIEDRGDHVHLEVSERMLPKIKAGWLVHQVCAAVGR